LIGRARAVGLCLAICVSVEHESASAHSGHDVVRAERYLKLEATDSGLRFVVSVSYGAEEMLRVARMADEDQDGTITERESRRFMEDWAQTLRRELPVRSDGSFVSVLWAEGYFHPLGRISARPGTIEMTANISMMPGRHFIVITDQMRFESFDRTDVTFGERDGGTLITSGPSDQPTEIVRTLAYGRDAEIARVRVLGLAIELPPPELSTLPLARPKGMLLPLVIIPTLSLFAVAFARLAREAKARRRG
jgi:hypothetical protein